MFRCNVVCKSLSLSFMSAMYFNGNLLRENSNTVFNLCICTLTQNAYINFGLCSCNM